MSTFVETPVEIAKILTRGPVELVEAFLQQKRSSVKAKLHAEGNPDDHVWLGRLRTDASRHMFRAIKCHLDEIHPFINSWPVAMALLAGMD